jgi:hypothetical protein
LGQQVEVYGTLKDRYGNLGQNQLVDWVWVALSDTGSATVRPKQGFSNQEGLVRTFFSSDEGGSFEVSVIIQSAESQVTFEPITFAGNGTE